MTGPRETYVSIDVETAGPNPGRYSLLAIGACLVDEPEVAFYVEVQPTSEEFLPAAMAVSGLSLDHLREAGQPPQEAMASFERWLADAVPEGTTPVFVGFNAPFDWMFVNDWFHRYLGRNPFGHRALDIKAYAMGREGCTFAETSLAELARRYGTTESLTHHALEDAQVQADLFRRLQER